MYHRSALSMLLLVGLLALVLALSVADAAPQLAKPSQASSAARDDLEAEPESRAEDREELEGAASIGYGYYAYPYVGGYYGGGYYPSYYSSGLYGLGYPYYGGYYGGGYHGYHGHFY